MLLLALYKVPVCVCASTRQGTPRKIPITVRLCAVECFDIAGCLVNHGFLGKIGSENPDTKVGAGLRDGRTHKPILTTARSVVGTDDISVPQ